MKLYATTTSERATKGQGGNQFLSINIQAGKDRASILRFTITAPDDDTKYVSVKDIFFDGIWLASHFRNAYDETKERGYTKDKAKKQKGETGKPCKEHKKYPCPYCHQ